MNDLTKTDLREIADRIRSRVRRAAEDIIAVGQDLTRVKDQLDHGQFAKWIDREFCMSERSARRYMAVADWAESKSATVAGLPLSTLYLLASPSTPEEVAEEVVAETEAGKPPKTKEIKERVKAARVTSAGPAPAPVVDDQTGTTLADPAPEPVAALVQPFWESPEYKQQSEFKNKCLLLAVECQEISGWEVPQLDAEHRAALADIVRLAEAALGELRVKIEKQHSGTVIEAGVVEGDAEVETPVQLPWQST